MLPHQFYMLLLVLSPFLSPFVLYFLFGVLSVCPRRWTWGVVRPFIFLLNEAVFKQPEVTFRSICVHLLLQPFTQESMPELFELLDVDGSGQLDREEFVEGLLKLGHCFRCHAYISV